MYDLIIIGGGIAAITSAIYAARKRINFLMITKNIGEQFFSSAEIVNYPGIIKVSGVEMREILKKQLEFNGVFPNEGEEVKKIKKEEDGTFTVFTDKQEYKTKTIIIAVGAKPKKLNVPNEEKFIGKGITYCATCDGPLFYGMDVAVIGSGNSALEAADYMSKISPNVYLLAREKELRGHEYLQEKVKKNRKVKISYNSDVKEIFGENFVSGLRYEQNGKEKVLNVKGVIIEIGREPNTEFLKGFLELEEDGHIVIDCQTRTSIEGIFAAGDCASGHEYQYIIAAGQGCMAALKAAKFLAERKN
ncbi:MAG: FAD-dependent oxidoreductase [Candidatus Altiarchaeota archaeon]